MRTAALSRCFHARFVCATRGISGCADRTWQADRGLDWGRCAILDGTVMRMAGRVMNSGEGKVTVQLRETTSFQPGGKLALRAGQPARLDRCWRRVLRGVTDAPARDRQPDGVHGALFHGESCVGWVWRACAGGLLGWIHGMPFGMRVGEEWRPFASVRI